MIGILVALLPSAYFGAALWLDRYGVRGLPSGTYAAIVVAGARVMQDGRPSPALLRRTRRAVELFHAGHAPLIGFTGGMGDAPRSEAAVAADIARSLGVPDEAIVVEEISDSTHGNAHHLRDKVQGRILVVTDSYHAFRCKLVFAKVFGDAHAVGTPPPRNTRIRMALREVTVLALYALRGRLA